VLVVGLRGVEYEEEEEEMEDEEEDGDNDGEDFPETEGSEGIAVLSITGTISNCNFGAVRLLVIS